MNDIIERLRLLMAVWETPGERVPSIPTPSIYETANDAIARIEALEAALRILLELHNTKHQTHNDVLIVEHIRTALALETDK